MATPDSVQTLLNSANLGDRLHALNEMRLIDPAVAFTLIPQAVVDPNARVRYAAVSQLATLGQQNLAQALELLRDRLHDSEADVQAAAADAIAALHLTEAFDDLQTLYQTSAEWLVQFSIVAALGEMGDQRALPLLEAALDSGHELMQLAAVGSLGELGGDRAVELLTAQIANPDTQLRHRVAQALSQIATPAARAALETLAQDPVELIAQEAKTGLAAGL
jgi:HEAT repeat protein